MDNTEKFYTKIQLWATPALISGLAGIVLCLAAVYIDPERFYFSYLTAFVFWVGIMLGGLFFTMLHNISGGVWSVVLRRIMEVMGVCAPLFIILFVPLIFGIHDLYHWSHPDIVSHDALLQKKTGYLNIPFFIVRSFFYLLIWSAMALLLFRKSMRQDKAFDAEDQKRIKQISAPGIVVFALTITFASFDWLMSLEPHWYSTIFGVYIFAGSYLAAMAFMIVFALGYRKKGVLRDIITVKHYHDLGKFLFAFTIFWGYMAFSQYFLIWYGNIPEETVWFKFRWVGSWRYITLTLVFGQFLIPFLGLMTRASRRNLSYLKGMSIWLMLMHYVDIYWIVMPVLHPEGLNVSWIDLAALLAVGGTMIWYLGYRFKNGAMVPVKDPKLEESIHQLN